MPPIRCATATSPSPKELPTPSRSPPTPIHPRTAATRPRAVALEAPAPPPAPHHLLLLPATPLRSEPLPTLLHPKRIAPPFAASKSPRCEPPGKETSLIRNAVRTPETSSKSKQ